MHTLRSAAGLIVATAAFMPLGITAAWAPGSISLDEVMDQLKDNAKLVDEVSAELKKQGVNAAEVNCIGGRFGGNWINLGGARAIPFDCQIGSRAIEIDGELHFYDAAGNELDMAADDTPEKATSFKQLNINWQWN